MQTIQITNNQGTIICQQCGRWKTHTFASLPPINKPLKVKCRCGSIFDVLPELRQTYRKKTYLPGAYQKDELDYSEYPLQITDLSQNGVKFKTEICHGLNIDDTLNLTFTLNTSPRKQVQKQVKVKHIQDGVIGAQYSPDDMYAYRKDIGFYLMSN